VEILYDAVRGAQLVRTFPDAGSDPTVVEYLFDAARHTKRRVTRDAASGAVTGCEATNLSGWHMPDPEWLARRDGCACRARYAVLQRNATAAAWRCPAEDPSVSNWYWFRHAEPSSGGPAHGVNANPAPMLPLRFVLVDPDPEWAPLTPAVGAVHFADFDLEPAFDAATFAVPSECALAPVPAPAPAPAPLPPPLAGVRRALNCTALGVRMPEWPERMRMTWFSTATDGREIIPGEVFYDAVNGRQLTRMYLRARPDGAVQDAGGSPLPPAAKAPFTGRVYDEVWDVLLTPERETYNVRRFRNGTLSCGATLPIPPPAPTWMRRDCACRMTLSPDSPLSPGPHGTAEVQCPVGSGRVFVHWYRRGVAEGEGGFGPEGYLPTVFFETASPESEGIALAWTDYVSMDFGEGLAPFPEDLWAVPPACENATALSGVAFRASNGREGATSNG
jgi:hypothetical protein